MSILLPILLGVGISLGIALLVELAMRMLERTAPEPKAVHVDPSANTDHSTS